MSDLKLVLLILLGMVFPGVGFIMLAFVAIRYMQRKEEKV